jgi:hypothetical protein
MRRLATRLAVVELDVDDRVGSHPFRPVLQALERERLIPRSGVDVDQTDDLGRLLGQPLKDDDS